MNDKDYFSKLYEIARFLNNEHSLNLALNKSLEKLTEILELETGWIWLTEPNNKSVYLAASYNLPPALSKHPERLSGRCYCIQQYLEEDLDEARNISEIACSRLADLSDGTKDLKFHATIPISSNTQKIGILNLLSKERRQLGENELTILNTSSELIAAAIQRTRLYSQSIQNSAANTNNESVLSKLVMAKLDSMSAILKESSNPLRSMEELKLQIDSLKKDVSVIQSEIKLVNRTKDGTSELIYPESPLTSREMQVLSLIQKGLINERIGKQLFIAERTVKFHISSILSKLHAENRTEAVDIALRRGLISL